MSLLPDEDLHLNTVFQASIYILVITDSRGEEADVKKSFYAIKDSGLP